MKKLYAGKRNDSRVIGPSNQVKKGFFLGAGMFESINELERIEAFINHQPTSHQYCKDDLVDLVNQPDNAHDSGSIALNSTVRQWDMLEIHH